MSQKKTSPSYTIIANKLVPYKLIITKEHTVDMMGKDAPGVGSYHWCDKQRETLLTRKSPSFGIPMAPRFENVTRFDQYKVSNKLGYYMGPGRCPP